MDIPINTQTMKAAHMKILNSMEITHVNGGASTNANDIDRLAIPTGLAAGTGVGAIIGGSVGGPIGAAIGAVLGSVFGVSVGAAAHPIVDQFNTITTH
jgi:hypothetical protein